MTGVVAGVRITITVPAGDCTQLMISNAILILSIASGDNGVDVGAGVGTGVGVAAGVGVVTGVGVGKKSFSVAADAPVASSKKHIITLIIFTPFKTIEH
jgi:hypothetical protein